MDVAASALRDLAILVVEDTLLIADLIADELQEAGCHVVGPVSRLDKALVLAKTQMLDGALLDVNLAGEYCFPIAAVLAARGIPFAFLTGYGDAILPPDYRTAPRLTKPFNLTDLTNFVAQHFAKPD